MDDVSHNDVNHSGTAHTYNQTKAMAEFILKLRDGNFLCQSVIDEVIEHIVDGKLEDLCHQIKHKVDENAQYDPQ